MGGKKWDFFFDRRVKVRRIIIIWEALAKAFKVAYAYSVKIGTALGILIKAPIRYTYSVLVKQFAGSKVEAKVQATYRGISVAFKGQAIGLVVRTTYRGISALLKGRPVGFKAQTSYSARVKVGANLGMSIKTSYRGIVATLKGRPTGLRVQASYFATSRQSATSGTKINTKTSYSASAVAEVNPEWLPKFDLSTDKSVVNTLPGAAYSITFTITNVGGLEASAEVSVWDVDGTLKDKYTVTLKPNESHSKTISFTAPQEPGTYYVTGRVKNLFTDRIDDRVAVEVNVAPAE
jgi:hypothetical protein